jgi:type III pantothenate kinase
MSITLCFDFGNTRMKLAAFADGEFLEEKVLADDQDETIRALIDHYHPDKAILSSVIDHNPGLERLLEDSTRFHRLGYRSKLPFTTPVGKPETIGADRLALVAAAVTLFPGRNNLVIGLGSAITYNYVNKYREFIGGSISPGMEMRFRALHEFTARLPLVKADWNFPLAGYDTRTNILSGVILGMAREVDGIVCEYEAKYDNFNVLMSGGDSAYFSRRLKKRIFADPNLIFKGLYAISEINL